MIGSVGLISKSIVCRNRVNIAEPISPAATPNTTIRAPSPSTIFRMSLRCAPSAIRRPISPIRRLKV